MSLQCENPAVWRQATRTLKESANIFHYQLLIYTDIKIGSGYGLHCMACKYRTAGLMDRWSQNSIDQELQAQWDRKQRAENRRHWAILGTSSALRVAVGNRVPVRQILLCHTPTVTVHSDWKQLRLKTNKKMVVVSFSSQWNDDIQSRKSCLSVDRCESLEGL